MSGEGDRVLRCAVAVWVIGLSAGWLLASGDLLFGAAWLLIGNALLLHLGRLARRSDPNRIGRVIVTALLSYAKPGAFPDPPAFPRLHLFRSHSEKPRSER